MALINSIKHGKGKLAGYLKQAKKLLHASPAGDRKLKTSEKAKMSRKISKTPLDLVSKPAISDAHVGDTEVVLNDEYDCNSRAWNELSPMPSELPQHAKPSTVSEPELEDQEPTVDKGDDTLLELATIGDSIARIFESASEPSSLSTTSTSTTTSNMPPSETLSSNNRTIWVPRPHHLPSFSSFCPSPPKRFQRSPFFGKKIGVTPRVSRITSVSGALDPQMPAFESSVGNVTAGSTIGGGSENELEAQSEDVEITLIGLKEGDFEDFGGENGGRPFVAILADLRALLGHEPSSSIRTISSPSTSLLSIEEGYERALAKIVELRGCLERMSGSCFALLPFYSYILLSVTGTKEIYQHIKARRSGKLF